MTMTMTKVLQNISKINTLPENSVLRLDTLAQPCTDPSKSFKNTLKTYEKRARSKYLSNGLVLALTKLDSPLKQSYWNTWHCSKVILQDGKKLTTTYCNNRWCIQCNRIRTAKLIKAYLPELKKMVDPQFVTLTIPNVPDNELKSTIDGMIQEFIRIKDLFTHRRDFRINGVRKLECTHNKEKNDFHPHFHIVLDGKQVGEALIQEWLSRYPGATRSAQDIRPANLNSMIELFKYATKLTTKSLITKENDKTVIEVNAKALDTIFQAMYKKRIFQSMGWVKQVSEDIDEVDSQIIEDVEENIEVWTWEQEYSDWVSSSGELLTGCDAYQKYELRFQSG
jgi:hypothetical protein